MTKKFFLMILLILALLIGCTSPGKNVSGKDNIQIIETTDFGEVHFSDYFIYNNIWNKGTTTNYTQYIYKPRSTDFPLGWKFDWPDEGANDIKAYPSINFGWHPWHSSTSTTQLPKSLNQIIGFNVKYNLVTNIDANASYDLSFDIWITHQPGTTNIPDSNISREIMIWIDYSADLNYYIKYNYPLVIIDGVEYWLMRIEDLPNPSRDFILFGRNPPAGTGSLAENINIKAFLDYLLKQNYLDPHEYVDMLSLGNEICHGSGAAIINYFQASVN